MSRYFNGTSDNGQIALNLSAYSTLTVSCWLFWNTNSTDNKEAYDYGATNYQTNNGFVLDVNGAGGILFGIGTPGQDWLDNATRPSPASWHHYLCTFDRATPVNALWIDGVSQTLTAANHGAAAYGNFGNTTLNLMSRGGASAFGAGRMADLAIWGGIKLGTTEAVGLSQGTPPTSYSPSVLVGWWQLLGNTSPEPNSYGSVAMTLTGTLKSENPPSPFYPSPIPGGHPISGFGAT